MGIGSLIGGAVGLVGSVIGSSSNRRAANQAAEVSQQNTDATVGLQREIYNSNRATLNPFVTRGNAAGAQINDLLGLGGSQQTAPATTMQPNALSQFRTSPAGGAGAPYGIADGIPAWSGFGNAFGTGQGFNPAAYGDATGDLSGGRGGAYFPRTNPIGQPTATTATPGPVATTGATPQDAQASAFDGFRNSTGYQFRLGEGMNALNSGYAGAGVLQSGAAMRDAVEYGQNFASNEFGNYVGLLSQQQGTGLQAAGAQAGVGVNYGNTVAQLNQTNANNQANAAITRGNNNVFGNALGTLGGYALGAFG